MTNIFNKLKYKFDIVWCCHVIYHFKANYILTFLRQMYVILKSNSNSYLIMGIQDDNSPETIAKRIISPQYYPCKLFELYLNRFNRNNNKFEWYMLQFISHTPMKNKESAIGLLTMMLEQALTFERDSVRNGKLNDMDRDLHENTLIKNAINISFEKVFITEKINNNDNNGGTHELYIFNPTTNYYILRKNCSHLHSKI